MDFMTKGYVMQRLQHLLLFDPKSGSGKHGYDYTDQIKPVCAGASGRGKLYPRIVAEHVTSGITAGIKCGTFSQVRQLTA